jgi:predicted RNA-binding Zn-ribbon protein involved in translation (DUF1610 family)
MPTVGRASAPHSVIRTQAHHCRRCGWHGPGRDLRTEEIHEVSCIIDYACPSCGEGIAFSYPVDQHGRPV